MAFSRQNTGSTISFTRDGALTKTVSTPPFQIFQASTQVSSYSLGGAWRIKIDNTTDTLSFLHNTSSVLTLTQSGFRLNSIVLPPQAELPDSPDEGTMINVGGVVSIYL